MTGTHPGGRFFGIAESRADGSRGPLCNLDYRRDPDAAWAALMETHAEVDRKLSRMTEQVRPFDKRLAMTEGHYSLVGRNRGDILSTWAAGVAYARILNTIHRHSDLLDIATCADFFGNRWQVNAILLPTPVWSGTPFLMPVGQVMALFGGHTGTCAIPVCCSDHNIDVTASLDGDRIFLHLVNTSAHRSVRLPLAVQGRTIRNATVWEIAADPMLEIMEHTAMQQESVRRPLPDGVYSLPAAGVAAIELDLAPVSSLSGTGFPISVQA